MSPTAVLIWPWWVRATHWLVAAGGLALWLMSHVWYETDVWHRSVGYVVLALIVLRMLLGCLTTVASARLTLPSWAAVRAHVAALRQRQVPVHMGHNPLGQWAVYLIWLLIAALALTGWLSRTDAFWGEDWPVDLHAGLSWMLMGLIAVHVLAVFRVGQWSGQALVRQMWHGRFQKNK